MAFPVSALSQSSPFPSVGQSLIFLLPLPIPLAGGGGKKALLSREGQQTSREKSLKLLEGQGRGDREGRGEASGHCCLLMPLPTVQGEGMGTGMLGVRSNREERGAGETHC